MEILANSILAYYVIAIGVLCLYGLHRYWLVWLYLRRLGDQQPPAETERFAELPRVTVQLPMYNEANVAERVIEAACVIDYPADKLQVQVLDDSTDGSAEIAAACCRRLVESGHDVQYLHRTDRSGYKAGALAKGLDSATGEFVAVFDADFVPPREFLQRTIHEFRDASIGMVQTRWAHLNREESLLTRIQAMSLDAHFVVEQAARAFSGRWFNFNGTAGIWRRRCIDEAGGWQHDTLTEDTDLSYRAQLAGWRFRYRPDVRCPAELPPSVSALMGQQHRWTKGLIQTGIKLLPTILRSKAPLATKIEAWFHLTAPAPYIFILLLAVIALPGLFLKLPVYGVAAPLAFGIGLACLVMGTLAACVFYVVSQGAQGMSTWRTVLHLPVLMALGVGISVMNTRAALEAIFGGQTPFVRTPKYAGRKISASDPASRPRRHRVLPEGSVELVLGTTMAMCVYLSFQQPFTLVGVPFLLLFGVGFFAIGVPRALGRGVAR